MFEEAYIFEASLSVRQKSRQYAEGECRVYRVNCLKDVCLLKCGLLRRRPILHEQTGSPSLRSLPYYFILMIPISRRTKANFATKRAAARS